MDQLTSSSRTSDKKTSRHLLSWWFQPIRKNMLVKLDHFCKDPGEMVRSIKTITIRVATGTSLIQSLGYPRDFVHLSTFAFVFFAFAARAAFFRFSSEFEVDEEPVERNLQLAFREFLIKHLFVVCYYYTAGISQNANPIITTLCFEISFGRKQTQPFLGS